MGTIFHEIFAFSRPGMTVDETVIKDTIAGILEENSHNYSEVMATLHLPRKLMLIAVSKDKMAKHPTSDAFVKRHALPSASSAQKALAKLLEDQLITYAVQNGEKEFGMTDKFLELCRRLTDRQDSTRSPHHHDKGSRAELPREESVTSWRRKTSSSAKGWLHPWTSPWRRPSSQSVRSGWWTRGWP